MEQDVLQISGLQHFAYCPRQWALIYIEQQWQGNERTVSGILMHQRALDEQQVEKRRPLLVMRGLRVSSSALGATGICDVVEFHQRPDGVALPGYEGLWLPYPRGVQARCPQGPRCR